MTAGSSRLTVFKTQHGPRCGLCAITGVYREPEAMACEHYIRGGWEMTHGRAVRQFRVGCGGEHCLNGGSRRHGCPPILETPPGPWQVFREDYRSDVPLVHGGRHGKGP